MRDTFKTTMYCSIHQDVKLDIDLKSKIHFPDSYTTEVIMYVHPCSQCKYELDDIKISTKQTLELLGYKKTD